MIETEEKPAWIKFISKALTLDEALKEYALWEESQASLEGDGSE